MKAKKFINNILKQIKTESICKSIDFEDGSWRKDIPSEPGWYFFKTNTPIKVLKSMNKPAGINHYNISAKISNKNYLLKNDILVITQSNNELYFVYNGETINLKARAREHYDGHDKTYCLALKQYEKLKNYDWQFHYLPVSNTGYQDHKVLRKSVEQGWRVNNGWPILSES